MSEFSPLLAETSDMELAVTKSRIKGWRRNRRSARSLLPAVRAVDGGFQRRRLWRLLSKLLERLASFSRKRRCFNENESALRQIGGHYEQK